MSRSCKNVWWLVALVAAFSTPCFAADTTATLAGMVRDAHGVPQMGALVQLLSTDAQVTATAFTDNHGRYLIAAVVPGRYALRASAAFFMPATKDNLQLRPGSQAIVNLTMSTLFEASSWLPAQSRRADEPSDDWKWTLRSTASRPLLRFDDSHTGQVLVSSSSESAHRATDQSRVTLTNGDGAFGSGGLHQVLVIDRSMENGDGAILRTDIGEVASPQQAGSSVEIVAGYEKRTALAGNTRLVTGFQSHPEIIGQGSTGAQVFRTASTEQVELGDTLLIDAGSMIELQRLASTLILHEPFLRVGVRVSPDVLIEYRYAASRELQSSDDLDQLKAENTVLTDGAGRPVDADGSHEEISISRKVGHRVIQASAYSGHVNHAGIAGSGQLLLADFEGAAVLADPSTGTFRLTAFGYSDRGVSLSMVQPLTPALSAWVSYDLGTALVRPSVAPTSLEETSNELLVERQQAASVSLRGKIVRSGTAVRAEYRWQPRGTLTQVNSYNASPNDAYLSFYLRQRIWCGHLLPEGLDMVIDATNLTEEGYVPVLASDGHTVYLAQVPRAVRGGLAFNF